MPSAKHKTTQKHKEGKERGLMDFRLLPVEQQHLWNVTKEERCKKKTKQAELSESLLVQRKRERESVASARTRLPPCTLTTQHPRPSTATYAIFYDNNDDDDNGDCD